MHVEMMKPVKAYLCFYNTLQLFLWSSVAYRLTSIFLEHLAISEGHGASYNRTGHAVGACLSKIKVLTDLMLMK